MAALAITTQIPSDDLLLSRPYCRSESLITPVMCKNIIFQVSFQILILGITLYLHQSLEDGKQLSIFFNMFVMLMLFNQINCRKLKNTQLNSFKDILKNNFFILFVGLEFTIQILLMTYGGKTLGIVPLTLSEHIKCLAVGSLSLGLGIIGKLYGPDKIYISWSK